MSTSTRSRRIKREQIPQWKKNNMENFYLFYWKTEYEMFANDFISIRNLTIKGIPNSFRFSQFSASSSVSSHSKKKTFKMNFKIFFMIFGVLLFALQVFGAPSEGQNHRSLEISAEDQAKLVSFRLHLHFLIQIVVIEILNLVNLIFLNTFRTNS